MHGDNHVVSANADHEVAGHKHGEQSSAVEYAKCGSVSDSVDKDQAGGQCCSGICFSVVLTENAVALVALPTANRYLMPNAQTRSVAASGFLRPPQYLI
jgi:hypothetical protein